MGQVFKKYWTNISKKPNGFKFVRMNVYEYVIYFRITVEPGLYPKYEHYEEVIPVPYKLINEKYSRKTIDHTALKKTIHKMTGVNASAGKSYTCVEMFKRDGDLFPFVDMINILPEESEKYLRGRELRERIIKINKLKNKKW